jgi:hypothetical protein
MFWGHIMIIFINCKITDVKRPGSPLYHRWNLRPESRLDIAKYSFASLAPLSGVVSKFVFYLDMADSFCNKKEEMQSWLMQVLPADKLSLHWFRCNHINQWKEAAIEFEEINDNIIFPLGNDDHVFLDSNTRVFCQGLDLISHDPDPHAVLMTSHYPEFMCYAKDHDAVLSPCGNYVVYTDKNWDAIRVMKKTFWDFHLSSITDDRQVFRTEDWYHSPYPHSKIYVPTKEQFRHYDGYSHVGIGPTVCPPLDIPPGFQDKKLHIRYGYDDIDPTAINVNPNIVNFRAHDTQYGVDHRFALADIPEFWGPFIEKISINPDLDAMISEKNRDQYFLDLLNHFGNNVRPASWISNHLICPG